MELPTSVDFALAPGVDDICGEVADVFLTHPTCFFGAPELDVGWRVGSVQEVYEEGAFRVDRRIDADRGDQLAATDPVIRIGSGESRGF